MKTLKQPNAMHELPEAEHSADPLEALLANAPEDDEPFDERDLEDTEGPYIAHADVIRERNDD